MRPGVRNNVDRENTVFIHCEEADPHCFIVDADARVEFSDANRPVVVLDLVVRARGSLRAVVENVWRNKTAEQKFSLLARAETLTLVDNPAAVRDLVDYVEGRYELSDGWKVEQLDRKLVVAIRGPGDAVEATFRLGNHFDRVTVDGKPLTYYYETDMQQLKRLVGQGGQGPASFESAGNGENDPSADSGNRQMEQTVLRELSRYFKRIYINGKEFVLDCEEAQEQASADVEAEVLQAQSHESDLLEYQRSIAQYINDVAGQQVNSKQSHK